MRATDNGMGNNMEKDDRIAALEFQLSETAVFLKHFTEWAWSQHAETGVDWKELSNLAGNASTVSAQARAVLAGKDRYDI